jgi:hypothetical protein
VKASLHFLNRAGTGSYKILNRADIVSKNSKLQESTDIEDPDIEFIMLFDPDFSSPDTKN